MSCVTSIADEGGKLSLEPFEDHVYQPANGGGILGWIERKNGSAWKLIVGIFAIAALIVAVSTGINTFKEDPYNPIVVENPMEIVDSEGVIPTVEGILGPAIIVVYDRCGDENCTIVPLAYTQYNSSDEAITVKASGSYYSEENDRVCPSNIDSNDLSVTFIEFPVDPGETQFLFNSNIPDCTIDDLDELAEQGIHESKWIVTGTYQVPNGEDVSLFSLQFTLIHPDSELVD